MSSAWLVVEYFMLSCHLTSASESISYDVSQLSKLCSTQSSQVVCIPLKDARRQLRHEESIQLVGFHAAAWGEAAHEVPEYPAGCAGVSRHRNSWWGVLVQAVPVDIQDYRRACGLLISQHDMSLAAIDLSHSAL